MSPEAALIASLLDTIRREQAELYEKCLKNLTEKTTPRSLPLPGSDPRR